MIYSTVSSSYLSIVLQIWNAVDTKQGYLTRNGLYKALALTALAQQGKPINDKLLDGFAGQGTVLSSFTSLFFKHNVLYVFPCPVAFCKIHTVVHTVEVKSQFIQSKQSQFILQFIVEVKSIHTVVHAVKVTVSHEILSLQKTGHHCMLILLFRKVTDFCHCVRY